MQTGRSSRSNPLILVAIIVFIALALSVASYLYVSYISNQIVDSSTQSTGQSAQTEGYEVGVLMVDELSQVGKNLQVLAASPPVVEGDVTAASPLFVSDQNSTGFLTESYFWIGEQGDLLVAKNRTRDVPAVPGTNLTSRPYFLAAESLGTTYYGNAVFSLTGQPVIVIAQPVYNESLIDGQTSRVFEGVVGASIPAATLGHFLESALPASLKSTFGAIASSGVILYTDNQSLVGQNVFGTEFQSFLPAGFRTAFNNFISASLQGGAGVDILSYDGQGASFAYQPVVVGSSGGGNSSLFGTIYIIAPDTIASSQAQTISYLRLFFEVVLLGIGGSAVIASVVVLRWNRSLNVLVKRRTADLESANIALEEQSQARQDLINIAAHELRTPAQSILASSELLKDAFDPDDGDVRRSPAQHIGPVVGQTAPPAPISEGDVKDLVNTTFRNAMRLQKLTQNLLEVARIDSKKFKLHFETFDINEKVRNVIKDLENVLALELSDEDRKSVKLVLQTQEPKTLVTADRLKTFEVISNLLRNAITHSSEGGTVTVTTRRSGGFCTVEVIDEGSGIDPAVLPRLFEKFATSSGMGLGLFISRSYVEAMGGKIWGMNNESRGKPGATFGFTLPLAEQQGEPGSDPGLG